jgi:hypothetical protein
LITSQEKTPTAEKKSNKENRFTQTPQFSEARKMEKKYLIFENKLS